MSSRHSLLYVVQVLLYLKPHKGADGTVKQLFQVRFQGEEVLGVLATCHWRKIDQHIQVAIRSSGTRSR